MNADKPHPFAEPLPHTRLFFAISDRLGKEDPLVAELRSYIDHAEMVKAQHEDLKEAVCIRRERTEKENLRLTEEIAALRLKYEFGENSEEE